MFSDRLTYLSCFLLLLSALTSTINAQTFAAAPKSEHLRRRDQNLRPSFGKKTLIYAERPEHQDAAPTAAVRLSFEPTVPTLLLDDLTSHIDAITCIDSKMVVMFTDADIVHDARAFWDIESELMFITSHASCAPAGHHGAFLVSYHDADVANRAVTLKTYPTSIRKSANDVYIDLGSHLLSDVNHKLRPRRPISFPKIPLPDPKSILAPITSEAAKITQAATSVASQATSEARKVSSAIPPPASILKALPTPKFPFTQMGDKAPDRSVSFPKPSGASNGASSSGDASFSKTDLTILPPDPSIAKFVPGVSKLNGIELKCKKCTMNAKISVQAAGFKLNGPDIEKALDFFESGWITFSATGMKADMEFEFGFLPAFTAASFTASLPSIPLGAIDVVGIVKIGPTLDLDFPMNAKINKPLTMTTGFTLEVPDKAAITLNVADIKSSKSTGFQDATITPTGFTSTVNDIELTLTAGFRPQLRLGADIGGGGIAGVDVGGGVAAFLDVPQLTSVITPSSGSDCQGKPAAGAKNEFVNIQNTATFDVGTIWDLSFNVPGLPAFNRGNQVDLAKKAIPLPSQCIDLSQVASAVAGTAKTGAGKAKTVVGKPKGKTS